MKELIKAAADSIPYPIGKVLGMIPMSVRLGGKYTAYKHEANRTIACNAQYNAQAKNLEKLLAHAGAKIQFYKEYYAQLNFDSRSIKTLSQFQLAPITTKKAFQLYSLEDRSAPNFSLKKSNTGGTTGQPLSFYLEKSAYAREWAHMHTIWEKFGYHYTDEKITIRGKNIGNCYYKYNFNQNEFLINAYAPIHENADACRALITKTSVKWIHGYPSSIYSFLKELEDFDPLLFEILITKIQGVFLGSEFPAPKYRDYIEKHCKLRSISWYGHSEMAVLAPEREPGSGIYYPFHSYGFTEAIPDGNSHRLIATSTHNLATPFIRYDTGDLIDPTFKDGLLESFRIKEGRNSDSVIDANGRDISLTGLIFGRHHRAFDFCEHVQVRQKIAGEIEILVTSKLLRNDWSNLFDFSNAYFKVTIVQIDSPIRTPSGKVQLLLRPE